jgi:hypothetical protein
MYEITKTPSNTPLPTIQSTTGFAEIRHGRELAVDRAGGVPTGIEGVAGFLRAVFVFKACIDVAD